MKTNYRLHDDVYQRRRGDPTYMGWIARDQIAEDITQTWQPLITRPAFPSQGNLLDIGCGAGHVSLFLAQQGYEVTGVDIAPTAIAWAKENADAKNLAVTFQVMDVLTLADLADASFDIVLDGRCFHCIIGGDRDRFLQAAHRVLRVGGILTLCSMCNDVPETIRLQGTFDPESRCLMHGDLATRYIGDSNDILKEVMQAGFTLIDVARIPPKDAEDFADLQVIAEKRG
jgi:SAM-dependent methyltransferase